MKTIILVVALAALCGTAFAAECDDKCMYTYCVAPNQGNMNAITQCMQNGVVMLGYVRDSCANSDFSDACIKQRVTKSQAFLDFFHCMRACYPNGIKSFNGTPLPNKIHDLSKAHSHKENKIDESKQTAEPAPAPAPAPAAAPKTTTFKNILSFVAVALSIIFAL